MGRIGGIASMSVIVITLCSPLLGWLISRRGSRRSSAYLWPRPSASSRSCSASPSRSRLSPTTWMIIISVYVLFAAGAPVWLILQPRDFINVQILYGGIVLMVVSLFSHGLRRPDGHRAPSFNLAEGVRNLGFIWPMMFFTIACGAISGFHALVAGGTTGKQLRRRERRPQGRLQRHAARVAPGGLRPAGDRRGHELRRLQVHRLADRPGVKSNPILGFSLAAGQLFNRGLGIPVALGTVFGILLVEGFVITTLDAAVRLNRYLFEELWRSSSRAAPASSGTTGSTRRSRSSSCGCWPTPTPSTCSGRSSGRPTSCWRPWACWRSRPGCCSEKEGGVHPGPGGVHAGHDHGLADHSSRGYVRRGNYVLIAADLLMLRSRSG